MDKWRFVPKEFNGYGEAQQLGSIKTPVGLWFAAVECDCVYAGKDETLIKRVIAVLNRELPGGKPRKRGRK